MTNEQIEAALESAWRAAWPDQGPNFIHPALVARTLAPVVAQMIRPHISYIRDGDTVFLGDGVVAKILGADDPDTRRGQ